MLKLLVSQPCVRRCRHIETQSNHALTGAYVSNQRTNLPEGVHKIRTLAPIGAEISVTEISIGGKEK